MDRTYLHNGVCLPVEMLCYATTITRQCIFK